MKIDLEEILRLSVEERLVLVDEIWQSIEKDHGVAPLSPEQVADLDRRLDEYESNPTATKSWDEVRERMERGE